MEILSPVSLAAMPFVSKPAIRASPTTPNFASTSWIGLAVPITRPTTPRMEPLNPVTVKIKIIQVYTPLMVQFKLTINLPKPLGRLRRCPTPLVFLLLQIAFSIPAPPSTLPCQKLVLLPPALAPRLVEVRHLDQLAVRQDQQRAQAIRQAQGMQRPWGRGWLWR